MSALDGEVKIPKIGGVKKKTLLIVGGLAAAFVGWRYMQASGADSYETDATDTGDYVDDGTIPSVSGAYKDDNSYGLDDDSTNTTDSYGFTGTTNAQWTQYAAIQLSTTDWSQSAIATALGNYINNRPLTTAQQEIVQAAIAYAGYPPVGNHPVIPGGDTDIIVAPPDVKVTSTTDTTANLSWGAVSGASEYLVFHTGTNATVISGGTSRTVTGLKPNTSYSFQVAARSSSGKTGPKSTSVTGRTKNVVLATPSTPTVSSITATSAVASTKAVSGATGYNWYINGVAHGHSDAPKYTLKSLKRNTTQAVSVAADTATGAPSKQSGRRSFKTKK